MTRKNERDESIDTLLRSSLKHPASGERPEECPAPEMLAAWTEGQLFPSEAARVETHLASCASCQEVLAVFARTEPSAVSPSPTWQRLLSGWRPQWAIPIAAAATAAAIWVAVPKDRGVDKFERTIGSTISQSAPQAPSSTASADAAAPAREKKGSASGATSEGTSEETLRRDAPSAPPPARDEQPKEEQRVADANDNARQLAANEQDQDRKAEAPAAKAAAPAQEETRLRAESAPAAAAGAAAQSSLARQAPATEAVSPDPLIRWRILSPRRLERSANGGKTWEPVPFPQPIDLAAVRAPSATTAIVTTADGRQFRTDDQGKTWNPIAP